MAKKMVVIVEDEKGNMLLSKADGLTAEEAQPMLQTALHLTILDIMKKEGEQRKAEPQKGSAANAPN